MDETANEYLKFHQNFELLVFLFYIFEKLSIIFLILKNINFLNAFHKIL